MSKRAPLPQLGPEVRKVSGPAFLASALVNDDASGLDREGHLMLEAFKAMIAPAFVVSVEEEDGTFVASIHMHGNLRYRGDCVAYVTHQPY